MKMFIYVIADQADKLRSPLRLIMAVDLHTAKFKILEELRIHEDDLWIMEFHKN